jgi:hypothetical protein
MRRRHGVSAEFFFVIEDLDLDGNHTRPHIHGSIAIPRLQVPRTKQGEPIAKYRRIIAKEGVAAAEIAYGLKCIRDVLALATGNDRTRPRVYGGVDQSQNKWTRKPTLPFFSDHYVNYIFKNSQKTSALLPENRLARSQAMTQEATRLWNLIRNGESALAAWH